MSQNVIKVSYTFYCVPLYGKPLSQLSQLYGNNVGVQSLETSTQLELILQGRKNKVVATVKTLILN